MDINRVSLNALFRTYMTAWQAGLEWKPPVDVSFLFTEFPSTTASNFYAWMDLIPGFREWVGDRVFNNVRSQNFEILNRDWEDSVSMPNKDIEDDQYGVYTPMVGMMGAAWKQLLYDIIIEVITANPVCYTGQATFANAHPYGDNTVDNLTANALSVTNFNTAFTDSATWQFSNGELIRPVWTHLLHGPKLRETAFSLVDNKTIIAESSAGGTADNPNYKRCQRVELPDLINDFDDYWVLVDASKMIKAIALQIRKVPVPLMDTDPATVARSGQIDFMADGRAAAGPTYPHMMYGARL
jgi:phage major head subunit gpT-like protein